MKVAMLGAGVMGRNIARVMVQAGAPVTLFSRSRETLDGARRTLAGCDGAEVTSATSIAEAVATADLIIESVPESVELKLRVLAEAERAAPDGVVIATNTSSLPLDRLAAAVRAPERFLGWHWFNPAHLIPLVEVVPTALTDPGVVAWSVQRLEQVGKRPLVLSRPVDGFLANRLQYALIREALALVDAGVATPEQIDAVLTDCLGLRWAVLGPMRSTDLAGITTAVAVATELFPKLSNADRPPACLNDLAEQGRLGLSAGAGFYAYPDPDEVLDTRDRLLASVWHATQPGRSERP
jgi:3-hydroxybutyryl-CoA dehydrogenase